MSTLCNLPSALYPSSRYTTSNTSSSPTTTSGHNFLTFLAVTQFYNVDIIPITWQFALESAASSGTAKIYESCLDVKRNFVFKRTRITDSIHHDEPDACDDDQTYNALVSEVSIACHPLLRNHPNIIKMKGISWETTETGDGVWPVIVLDKATFGDLEYFMNSEEGKNLSVEKRLCLCADVASAIRALHSCNGVHGDVKPQNVFIQLCPHGKMLAQIADFGWSFLPHDGDRNTICKLAKSTPWNAPEHHHRGFSIEQAQKQDVFSFGMLCLWILFHDKISAEAGNCRNGENPPVSVAQQHKQVNILLGNWKIKGKLQEVALGMVATRFYKKKKTRKILDRLFISTLAHDPDDREKDFGRLENIFKRLNRHRPRLRQFSETIPSLSSISACFRTVESFFQLIEGDYRIRKHLAYRLEAYAKSISDNHPHYRNTAFELAFCYHLGFGISRDTEKAQCWVQQSGRSIEDLESETELIRQLKWRRIFRSDDLLSLANQGLLNGHQPTEQHGTVDSRNSEMSVLKKEIEDLTTVLGKRHLAVQELQCRLSTIYQEEGLLDDAEAIQIEVIEAMLEDPEPLERLRTHVSALDPLSPPLATQKPLTIDSSPVLNRIESFAGKYNELMARSMTDLVNIFMHQCRWSEAEWMCIQLREVHYRLNGEHHLSTLHSAFTLGHIYGKQGRPKDAANIYQYTVDLCSIALGTEHWQTLRASEALADLAQYGYHWKNTEEPLMPGLMVILKTSRSKKPGSYSPLKENATLEEQFLALSESPDHSAAVGMSTLARMNACRKRFKEAEGLMRQSKEMCTKLSSEDHADTIMLMREFATLLIKQQRWREAENLLKEVVDRSNRALGKSAMISLDAASDLALTYLELGQLDEAGKLMQETLVAQKQTIGENHPNTLVASTNLAVLYKARGKNKDALMLLEDTVERQKEVLGEENENLFASLEHLAVLYIEEQRFDDSRTLIDSLIQRQENVYGLQDPRLLNTLRYLADSFVAQKRYQEATRLTERYNAITAETFDKTSPQALHSLMYLAHAYQREERWEDREKVFQEVVDRAKDALGLDHVFTKSAVKHLKFGKKRKWPEC